MNEYVPIARLRALNS